LSFELCASKGSLPAVIEKIGGIRLIADGVTAAGVAALEDAAVIKSFEVDLLNWNGVDVNEGFCWKCDKFKWRVGVRIVVEELGELSEIWKWFFSLDPGKLLVFGFGDVGDSGDETRNLLEEFPPAWTSKLGGSHIPISLVLLELVVCDV